MRPNQVWSSDMTYILLQRWFIYLVAIIDWFSRYILDGYFCQVALHQALTQGQPEIFNTDQSVQIHVHGLYRYPEPSSYPNQYGWDGRGRVLDNIFIERFWRSLKYEDIYLHNYGSVPDLVAGLQRYFTLYNLERPHQNLNYRMQAKVHFTDNPLLYVY